MAALGQRKGTPVAEGIKIRPCLWVGFELTEETVEAVEKRERRRS